MHLKDDGSKTELEKVPKCDMITRGLQRLDAQDRERWSRDCNKWREKSAGL